ncbi:MAG: hypothetical protein QOG15_521 [Solirubrobacteraceae bacterium]|jgi:hypothetical protein|nr:hypothetical protein [Solirubrobacteraceae bacterium]
MPRSSRILAAVSTAALIGAAASAAPAGAATITVPSCVVDYGAAAQIPSLPISGTGFTPGGGVNISYASTANPSPGLLGSTDTDAAGNFSANSLPVPFKSATTKQQAFVLAATDAVNPAITAATQFQQVRFGASANPSKGRAKHKVHYTARGFTIGLPVYMHFRFHGKTKKTVRLATAKPPCGIATRKLKLLPTKVRYGTWKVYIDQSKTYNKNTVIQAVGQITITKVFS